MRTYQDEHILVVANLSRFVQTAELDLSSFKGAVPVEIFGRAEFPQVGESPYFLSLSPHTFYWFTLTPKPEEFSLHGFKTDLPSLGGCWQLENRFCYKSIKRDAALSFAKLLTQ